MAAPHDLTVHNLTITESGDCAGGFSAGGFLNRVDPDSGISWIVGTLEPTGLYEASCGSLYSRRVGDPFPGAKGELWLQVSPGAYGWVKIAG